MNRRLQISQIRELHVRGSVSWDSSRESESEKNQRGFTLIEIMIAMAVMGTVLIGVIVGNIAIQKNAEAAFQMTRAIQDANQVMESIRKTARTGNFPANVIAVYPNAGAVSGFTSLSSETVTVSYSDTNGDGSSINDNPLDVTVTVSWLSNGVRSANTILRSLVTQR